MNITILFLSLSSCWLLTNQNVITSAQDNLNVSYDVLSSENIQDESSDGKITLHSSGNEEIQKPKGTPTESADKPENISRELKILLPKPAHQQGRHYVEKIPGFYPSSGSGFNQGGYYPNNPTYYNPAYNYPSGQFNYGQYVSGHPPFGQYPPGPYPSGQYPFGHYPSSSHGYSDRFDVFASRLNSQGNRPSASQKFQPNGRY